MLSKSPVILKLDVRGFPQSWISWQEAICFYVRDRVAWEIGSQNFLFHGGYSRINLRFSEVEINSIIAVKGKCTTHTRYDVIPKLSNSELFRRDRHMCLYCGQVQRDKLLTRDHVVPRSYGGVDRWSNVVTACRRCNVAKGGRTPEEANMKLLAIPFTPNRAEFLVLKNRRILVDQMDFLKKQFNHEQMMDFC